MTLISRVSRANPPPPKTVSPLPADCKDAPPSPGGSPLPAPVCAHPAVDHPSLKAAKPVVRLLLVEMTNKPLRFLRRYKARVRANRPVSLLRLSGAVR